MVRLAGAENDLPAFDRFPRAAQAGDMAALVDVTDNSTVPLIREIFRGKARI